MLSLPSLPTLTRRRESYGTEVAGSRSSLRIGEMGLSRPECAAPTGENECSGDGSSDRASRPTPAPRAHLAGAHRTRAAGSVPRRRLRLLLHHEDVGSVDRHEERPGDPRHRRDHCRLGAAGMAAPAIRAVGVGPLGGPLRDRRRHRRRDRPAVLRRHGRQHEARDGVGAGRIAGGSARRTRARHPRRPGPCA